MHFGPVGSEKNSTGGRLPAVVPVRLGTAISATSQPFWLWLSGRGRWRNGGRRKRDMGGLSAPPAGREDPRPPVYSLERTSLSTTLCSCSKDV